MSACTEKPNQTKKKHTEGLKRGDENGKGKRRSLWRDTQMFGGGTSQEVEEIKDPQFGGHLKKHRSEEWFWTPLHLFHLSRQNAFEFSKMKFSFPKWSVF